MFFIHDDVFLPIFFQLCFFLQNHPVILGAICLSILLLYKIINFTEIIVDFKEEIPIQARILPDQTLPPLYPNGWIPLVESVKVRKNQIKQTRCFGREFIVVRGNSNQVYVVDAFCPHLGANLGVGGVVEQNCNQDCIRCPFHSWSFRLSDGHCVDVPYEDSTPNAKIKVWNSIERNQIIFVWYHAEENVEPDWYPPEIEEISNKKWIFRGRTEHFVNCLFQEIPENGADIAHLNQIHSSSFMMGGGVDIDQRNNWLYRIIEHEWKAKWNPCDPPNNHMANLQMININKIFGMKLFEIILNVHQIGPAYVELHLKSSFCGGIQGVLLQMVKPIQPFRNSIIHHFYLDKSIASYIFSKFLLVAESKMVGVEFEISIDFIVFLKLERDCRIWNQKAFSRKPFIGRTERSLVKYRRWFNQFYSASSKSIQLDW